MGRPLKKDINGTEVLGTYANSAAGIKCEFYDGSTNQTDGVIIKQRGARTFVVARVGSLTTTYVCTLVDTAPNAVGEMRIRGYDTSGTGQGAQVTANLVPISKINKLTAVGFPSVPVLSNGFYRGSDSNASTNHDEKRYTWYLSNDSSADYIVLTPITAKS